MNKLILSIILILISFYANGQTEEYDHDLSIDDHRNHVGIAMGPVYVINEKEFAPGLHIHYSYLYEINHIHLGTGLGFETIFDEHNHFTTSINFSYFPIHNLTLTIAPGILFNSNSSEFTTHFETSYEFNFGKIHIGPLVEYAYARFDNHFMVGLHISFEC